MRTVQPLIVVGLLAALTPTPGAAQVARSDADTRELLAYQLSMPKLRQLNQAYAELHRLSEADPEYQLLQKKKRELAALEAKNELTEAEWERVAQLEEEIAALEVEEYDPDAEEEDPSLDAVVARIEAEPPIVAALKRAGLTVRESVLMQLALFQAGMMAEMLASGTITEIPKDVNAANVKFYQANKAELAKLTALDPDR